VRFSVSNRSAFPLRVAFRDWHDAATGVSVTFRPTISHLPAGRSAAISATVSAPPSAPAGAAGQLRSFAVARAQTQVLTWRVTYNEAAVRAVTEAGGGFALSAAPAAGGAAASAKGATGAGAGKADAKGRVTEKGPLFKIEAAAIPRLFAPPRKYDLR
jgi:hypothetical protein